MEIGIMEEGWGGLAGLDARGGAMGRIMIFLTQVRSILPGPDDMSLRARTSTQGGADDSHFQCSFLIK